MNAIQPTLFPQTLFTTGKLLPLFSKEDFIRVEFATRLPLLCKYCSKTFFREKRYIKRALNTNNHNGYTYEFCSWKCKRLYEYPPIYVLCKQCGKEFVKHLRHIKKSPNHFCNGSCNASYQNTHKTKGYRISKMKKWLQKLLPDFYPTLEFHFNRIDIINAELDIYISNLKLAFEINGIYHYLPIYGQEKLQKIQTHDLYKFNECLKQNIELFPIDISNLKHFTIEKAQPFFKIIQDIIEIKLGVVPGTIRQPLGPHPSALAN